MRDIKFRALFKHILTGKTLWYDIVVNYSLKNIEGYVQVSPWLQYTGLKDKEGKEIYEGDIVSYIDIPTNLYDGNYEVVFDAGFIGIDTTIQSNLCDILCHKYVEVIGNKYDNPELLKQ